VLVASSAPQEPANGDVPAGKPAPSGIWNTLLTSLPIGLTILATIFAGMSSSEMTQAMYYRSLASQHQSKAGDQWAFFQAKRIRGTSLEMTAELLQSLGQPAAFDPRQVDAVCEKLLAELEKLDGGKEVDDGGRRQQAMAAAVRIKKSRETLAKRLADPAVQQNLPYLTGFKIPKTELLALTKKDAKEAIDATVKAISQRQTEGETAELVRRIDFGDIEEATRLAEQNADAFDKAGRAVGEAIEPFRSIMAELAAAVRPFREPAAAPAEPGTLASLAVSIDAQNKGFRLAVIEFDARRYRQESSLNRQAAEMYEVRVRRSGVESDRHRDRSKMFFYSMLVAQLGVTVASLALARSQRKSLWLFAAVAGVAAMGFSGYVYVSF
jgi:hypothetical protein